MHKCVEIKNTKENSKITRINLRILVPFNYSNVHLYTGSNVVTDASWDHIFPEIRFDHPVGRHLVIQRR